MTSWWSAAAQVATSSPLKPLSLGSRLPISRSEACSAACASMWVAFLLRRSPFPEFGTRFQIQWLLEGKETLFGCTTSLGWLEFHLDTFCIFLTCKYWHDIALFEVVNV
ncbi:uncharacterized protein LOC132287157 [Cornus florida]|uniref:uncharacterized protein LOC132287157 n=1 Tax=Cornus florida TaxID=4283 RepID=UPI00289F0C63|nr:uncharacterized protein LOC132287157 [Cornus florida]